VKIHNILISYFLNSKTPTNLRKFEQIRRALILKFKAGKKSARGILYREGKGT